MKRKGPANRPPHDPLYDLPDAPAMRAGLQVRQVEQHRRGDRQAYRPPHWHRYLTTRQRVAADAYLRAASALGSPSTADSVARMMSAGVIDGSGAGDGESAARDRAREEWWAMHEAIPRGCRGQAWDVLWLLGPVTHPHRLRAAMDAVADWLDEDRGARP